MFLYLSPCIWMSLHWSNTRTVQSHRIHSTLLTFLICICFSLTVGNLAPIIQIVFSSLFNPRTDIKSCQNCSPMSLLPEETSVLTIVQCLCTVLFAFSLYSQNIIFQRVLGCSFLPYPLTVFMLFICNAFKFIFHHSYSILGSPHPDFYWFIY